MKVLKKYWIVFALTFILFSTVVYMSHQYRESYNRYMKQQSLDASK